MESVHKEDIEIIRVGTRASQLALCQTRLVISRLQSLYPHIRFEEVLIKTTGDNMQDRDFRSVGYKGMFIKEIEEALLNRRIDFAVHSMKDIPSELADCFVLAAILEREDPRDVLLSHRGGLMELPAGSIVGTSSQRRQALLKHMRPDIQVRELRGNVNTRVNRWKAGEYDAIVLAAAGLHRLGLQVEITEYLNTEVFIPAPGQGAITVETQLNNKPAIQLLSSLNHMPTALTSIAERSFQEVLDSGCSVPAGAIAEIRDDSMCMHAFISTCDGKQMLVRHDSSAIDKAALLGSSIGQFLLDAGGRSLLDSNG
jgi:hydroxymethylbilane synthase